MITALSLIACILCMLSSYLVARGRLRAVYIVGLASCCCLIALNVLLSVKDPGVLFMVIPSIWGIAMNVYGIRRLRRQRHACNTAGIDEESHSTPEVSHETHACRIRRRQALRQLW